MDLLAIFNERLLNRIEIDAVRVSDLRRNDPDGPPINPTPQDKADAAKRFADTIAALVAAGIN